MTGQGNLDLFSGKKGGSASHYSKKGKRKGARRRVKKGEVTEITSSP